MLARRERPELSEPINPYTASPTEFLRWLQLEAARNPRAFGSWRSQAAAESLRDEAALESHLADTVDFLRGNMGGIEADERDGWERSLEEWAKKLAADRLPDNAGNRAYYSMLSDLVEAAGQAAARLGYEVPEEVTFGLLPTGQVNGRACAIPAGGLLVAIDDGLFNFVYSIAKAIGTLSEVAVTVDSGVSQLHLTWIDDNNPRAVSANEDANRRWLEILTATFGFGYPNLAPMRPIIEQRANFFVPLTTSVELLVVAHEFGHLILGHYDRNHVASKLMLPGGVEVDEFAVQREEELEADRVGLELLREHHKSIGYSLDNTRWAIWFWAGCLNIIEGMSGGPARTHPPAELRSKRLLEQLAREDGTTIDTPSLGRDIYIVMRNLWTINEQRLGEWVRRAKNGEVPWLD